MNFNDQRLFLQAAYTGDLNKVKFFVDRGADVEIENADGQTPLLLAVFNGHLDVVKFLVCTTGADMEIETRYGRTSLSSAIANGHVKVVEFLKEVAEQRKQQTAVGNLTKSAARR